MISPYIKFHMPSSQFLLLIIIKRKAKHRFRAQSLFCILQKLPNKTYFSKIQICLTFDRVHLEILHGWHVDIIDSSKIKCKMWRWSAVTQWSKHFHENMTVQKLLRADGHTDKVIHVLISTYQIRSSNPNQIITKISVSSFTKLWKISVISLHLPIFSVKSQQNRKLQFFTFDNVQSAALIFWAKSGHVCEVKKKPRETRTQSQHGAVTVVVW